jgi:hypothetical protein
MNPERFVRNVRCILLAFPGTFHEILCSFGEIVRQIYSSFCHGASSLEFKGKQIALGQEGSSASTIDRASYAWANRAHEKNPV